MSVAEELLASRTGVLTVFWTSSQIIMRGSDGVCDVSVLRTVLAKVGSGLRIVLGIAMLFAVMVGLGSLVSFLDRLDQHLDEPSGKLVAHQDEVSVYLESTGYSLGDQIDLLVVVRSVPEKPNILAHILRAELLDSDGSTTLISERQTPWGNRITLSRLVQDGDVLTRERLKLTLPATASAGRYSATLYLKFVQALRSPGKSSQFDVTTGTVWNGPRFSEAVSEVRLPLTLYPEPKS